jgi:hypothetical protein
MSGIQSMIAGAVVAMQLNPDMPTIYCRRVEHGPLSKVDVAADGAPLLVCAQCGSVSVLTEEQVSQALGAKALPTSPVTAEFGTPVSTNDDAVDLRRAPLRIETAFGSLRATLVFALLVAACTGFAMSSPLGGGWAIALAVATAFVVDAAIGAVVRRRNRSRAPWLSGQNLQVIDLQPGTWIETPLNLHAAATDPVAYFPIRAARVQALSGLPESPQTGYLGLTLSDGRSYTVAGTAPIRTLHVELVASGRLS